MNTKGESRARSPWRWQDAGAVVGGTIGVLSFATALVLVQPYQFNVVTYAAQRDDSPPYIPALAFVWVTFVGIIGLALKGARRKTSGCDWRLWGTNCAPLLLAVPFMLAAARSHEPPFWSGLLLIVGAGWAALLAGRCMQRLPEWRWGHALAVTSLVGLLVAVVAIHTRLQIVFFEHFSLGHADFGHFTEELKNAWAGRGLRCDSFENTRLGWHFSPLLYVLVPGYALFPSPVYLMIWGALLVHVPAVIAYVMARRLSGSSLVGWLFGVSWILLPSQSRMVYANTYGFEWIYFSMWLLGMLMMLTVMGRWGWCVLLVVILLLCQETVAAATFGWGLCLLLFGEKKIIGGAMATVSLVYVLVCTTWIIPAFAQAGSYERAELFGALGRSLSEVALSPLTHWDVFRERIIRREGRYFVLTLLCTMAMLPVCRWRLAAMSLPTVGLVLLLANAEWLSIRFWYQCTVLPLLFFAGMSTLSATSEDGSSKLWLFRRRADGKSSGNGGSSSRGAERGARAFSLATAAFVCAALGHYFYGFSPFSKGFEPYKAAAMWHQPDARLRTVQRIRALVPKDRSVLATERMAAHFTDYRRLYTGRRQGAKEAAHVVVLDVSDGWDTSGLPDRAAELNADERWEIILHEGPVAVWKRKPDYPVTELD